MPDRADAVLAAIPTLAASGVVLSRVPPVLEATVGVGGGLSAVPFTALGLVAALGVIGLEVVDPSFQSGA